MLLGERIERAVGQNDARLVHGRFEALHLEHHGKPFQIFAGCVDCASDLTTLIVCCLRECPVGVIAIVAGISVALAPRFGGLLVAAWLAGIILNLVTMGEYYDVALRDFGLLVAALSLSLLAADRGMIHVRRN